MRKINKAVWERTVICACLALALALSLGVPAQAAGTRGYSFKYKKVSITPGADATKFIEKAGEVTPRKSPSCAAKGNDYVYTYKNFTLTTCTQDKEEGSTQYVKSIELKTKKVKTAEGLKVGQKEKKVKKKYPDATEKYGVYTATKGQSKIVITVEDGKVAKILICEK